MPLRLRLRWNGSSPWSKWSGRPPSRSRGCELDARRRARCGQGWNLLVRVESGLRSFDRTMPEEINRIVADEFSEYLFLHSDEAVENLRQEGISDERMHLVGNTMIDTMVALKAPFQGSERRKAPRAPQGLPAGNAPPPVRSGSERHAPWARAAPYRRHPASSRLAGASTRRSTAARDGRAAERIADVLAGLNL